RAGSVGTCFGRGVCTRRPRSHGAPCESAGRPAGTLHPARHPCRRRRPRRVVPLIMRLDSISCQPDLLDSPFSHSIVKRAQQKGLVEIHIHDLRKYAINKHGQIDDYAFGGGAGMVMMIEPIDRLLSDLKAEREYDAIIYMTPDGQTL